MPFLYEEKMSISPYVQAVWQTEDVSDGVYTAEADGCWDIIFISENNQTKILLSGPTSKPRSIHYKAGNRNLGIQFKITTKMTAATAASMKDAVHELSVDKNDTFELFKHTFDLPTYSNIEVFIAKLETLGLVERDEIIDLIMNGKDPNTSKRTIQRHFIDTTTIPAGYHQRIAQARLAIDLLRQNEHTIAFIAEEAGYADQAHMTRSLKRLAGMTPKDIIDSDGPIHIK